MIFFERGSHNKESDERKLVQLPNARIEVYTWQREDTPRGGDEYMAVLQSKSLFPAASHEGGKGLFGISGFGHFLSRDFGICQFLSRDFGI